MEIFLICNNLYENNLSYPDRQDIEKKKMTRPLSIEGEMMGKAISLMEELEGISAIYSSMFASSLASAKYLARRFDKDIIVDERLNDCKVGQLGNKSLKMVKFMQNHDFNIKLNGGESLEEVGSRIEEAIRKIIYLDQPIKVAVYTHKRTMLGYLIKHASAGYNLDDDLIIEYNDKVVYNDTDKDCDIVKITLKERQITNIEVVDL